MWLLSSSFYISVDITKKYKFIQFENLKKIAKKFNLRTFQVKQWAMRS